MALTGRPKAVLTLDEEERDTVAPLGAASLECQLRRQRVEPDSLVRGVGDLVEVTGELLDAWPPLSFPRVGMGTEQRLRRLGSQPAAVDLAARSGPGSLDRRWVGQPAVQVGAAPTIPALEMRLAHPVAGGTVTAPLDPTNYFWSLSSPASVRSRRRTHRGALDLRPPTADSAAGTGRARGRSGHSRQPGTSRHRNRGRTPRTREHQLGTPGGPLPSTPRAATPSAVPARRGPPSGLQPHTGIGEPSRVLQHLPGVFDVQMPVDIGRGGHRRMPQKLAHHLHRHTRPQQPGGAGYLGSATDVERPVKGGCAELAELLLAAPNYRFGA